MKLNSFLAIFSFCISFGQDEFIEYNQYILDNNLNLEMRPIVGGQFLMGSPLNENNRLADEGPVHKVEVDSFWMAKYETTWDLYNLFTSRSLDNLQPKFNSNNEVNIDVDAVSGATTPYVEMSFGMGTDGFPAISMTQLAAKKFCQWLSAITGNFYRLPTEAEWEYAARGGIESASYPWGGPYTKNDRGCFMANFKPLRGDYAADQALYTVEAKSFEPNDFNLYNMAGNVSEWVDSSYDPSSYEYSSSMNPNVNDVSNKRKVVRGGSWKDVSYFLQVSSRDYEYADSARSYIGFRTVQDYLGNDLDLNRPPQ